MEAVWKAKKKDTVVITKENCRNCPLSRKQNKKDGCIVSKVNCRNWPLSSQIKKKDGLIVNKENGIKCPLSSNYSASSRNTIDQGCRVASSSSYKTAPTTNMSNGVKSQCESRQLLMGKGNYSVPIQESRLQCPMKGLSNLKKQERGILAENRKKMVAEVNSMGCITKNSRTLKCKSSKNSRVDSPRLKRNDAVSISASLEKTAPVTHMANGVKSQCKSRQVLMGLDYNSVPIEDSNLQCPIKGLSNLKKQERGIFAENRKKMVAEVNFVGCVTNNSRTLKGKSSQNSRVDSPRLKKNNGVSISVSSRNTTNQSHRVAIGSSDKTAPATTMANGVKSQSKSRQVLMGLGNKSVPFEDSRLQCPIKGLSNLGKKERGILENGKMPIVKQLCCSKGGKFYSKEEKERGILTKNRKKMVTEVNSIGCGTKNSRTSKGKSSKNSGVDSSRLKRNAAASISARIIKKQVNEIKEVSYCYGSSLLIDSTIIDDDDNFEFGLIISEANEQELLELNLLPDGILTSKLTVKPVSTLQESEMVIIGAFHSFDGSTLNPMEEAFLILNSPTIDTHAIESCSNPRLQSSSNTHFIESFSNSSLQSGSITHVIESCANSSLQGGSTISSDVDDRIKFDLFNFKMSEQEFLDLNLLPDGLVREKLTMIPFSTLEKSDWNVAGGFLSFDGSRLSPIEEASLILNSPLIDGYAIESCSNPCFLSVSTATKDDTLIPSLTEYQLPGVNWLANSEKQIITPIITPEESERGIASGFHCFDGSKLNPFQEAFLILNDPIACEPNLIEQLEGLNLLTDSKRYAIDLVSTSEKIERVTGNEFQSFDGSKFNPIQEAFLILNDPILSEHNLIE